jgi:hypothetical protein
MLPPRNIVRFASGIVIAKSGVGARDTGSGDRAKKVSHETQRQ